MEVNLLYHPLKKEESAITLNLYHLKKQARDLHATMTDHRLNYEKALKAVRNYDIAVLALTSFCNRWYTGNITPHSNKQRHILALKEDVEAKLVVAKYQRLHCYQILIPGLKNTYKRSMVHYQRLVSMINRMERILTDKWIETNPPELLARCALDVRSTQLIYKVTSGEWGTKTGWHASLSYTSPSGQEITITV